jgi:hypothetical protein
MTRIVLALLAATGFGSMAFAGSALDRALARNMFENPDRYSATADRDYSMANAFLVFFQDGRIVYAPGEDRNDRRSSKGKRD